MFVQRFLTLPRSASGQGRGYCAHFGMLQPLTGPTVAWYAHPPPPPPPPPNVVYNRLAISPLGENQRPKRFQRQGELAALTRMQCIARHLFSNYTLDTKPRAQTRNTPPEVIKAPMASHAGFACFGGFTCY